MSIQTIVACAGLGAILTAPIVLQGGSEPPPYVSRGEPLAIDGSGIRTLQGDLFLPAAPGGAGPVAIPAESVERPVVEPATSAAFGPMVVHADRATMAVLGDVLGAELGIEWQRTSRRNVIEHVIAGTVPIGLVSVAPSQTERELGALDVPLGDFEPCIVIDWSNRFRHLTRRDAQNLLSGRARQWPGTQDPVQLFAPEQGEREMLLAELLIPGDTFTTKDRCEDVASLLESVRGDRLACGVVHRAAVPDGLGVLEIEGFRPRLTIRVVFRDQRAPEVERMLEFWRSARGIEILTDRLTLR
ncbi:MAG: hypothetical protein KDB80_07380 [Planctomycetes bacterium]|nr:hypothetical protein [Planctomycetota bacterium]